MGEEKREAITAIKDSSQEGFVAGALQRLGRVVVHRSTSVDGLREAMDRHPVAIVVASEDFISCEELTGNRSVFLASASTKVTSGRFINPKSDFELQELLHSMHTETSTDLRRVPPIQGDVTLVTSIQSGIGASTIALNLAQEYSQAGETTLLLEVHQSNPCLFEYLEIPHINRKITPTPLGFSVGEISNFDSLNQLSEASQEFQRVVLDLEPLKSIDQILHGNRLEDISSTWALQSATRVLLLARDGEKSISRLQIKIRELRESSLNRTAMAGIILQSSLGRKERNDLKSLFDSEVCNQVAIFSRDFRSVSKAETRQSSLLATTPKSVLRGEILAQLISPLREASRGRSAKAH